MYWRQVCRGIRNYFKAKQFCGVFREQHPGARSSFHLSSSRGAQTRHVSSRIYLQVIGTPCKDTAPSVLLFTDSER